MSDQQPAEQATFHPLELPANTAAAQAFYDAHPDLVSNLIPMAEDRTINAQAAIQDHVDLVNQHAEVATDDPRISGSGFNTPTVTSITPTSGPHNGVTSVAITGTNLAAVESVVAGDTLVNVTVVDAQHLTADTDGKSTRGTYPVEINITDYIDNPVTDPNVTFTFT